MSWHDVRSDMLAEPSSQECQSPLNHTLQVSFATVARDTFRMMSGHEMADAAALGGRIEQQSVWANREEAVVLNDDRFSKKQSNEERHKAWAG
jgi:hypothetical protein